LRHDIQYKPDNIICYGIQYCGVPNRTTYFSEEEMDELERMSKEEEISFSKLVRDAINEVYDI